MLHLVIKTVEIVSVAGTLASIGYYALCLTGASAFLRSSPGEPCSTHPRVSILKPLKGTDPDLYENLRSHCLQDYPEYEIIFGVEDESDPAAAMVRRIMEEFPGLAIGLVLCHQDLGANTKVSNLAQMVRTARHEILVVNDGDIRVGAEYLRGIVATLVRPSIGMVTCLYRGVSQPTLGSRLESLGISTDFIPGVLAALRLQGIRFGLGSTLAFRRSDLEKIGGFESLADYLADDYELGRRIAAQGLEIELSREVVETHLPAYDLREFIRHQLRWARTIRDSRPAGYVGLVLTFGLPWAILCLLGSRGSIWAWALLLAVAAMRTVVALVVGRTVLRDQFVVRGLALLPVRDLIAAAVWVCAFAGHRITWRGESFTLKKGKLVRARS